MPFNSNAAAGTVVYTDGAYNTGLVLPANQTVTNSATLVEVPELTFAIGKYERVLVRYSIFYTTTADGDLKYRLEIPASPTAYRCLSAANPPAATALVTALITAEADATAVASSGTDGHLSLNALVNNGANSGEVQFQFAQNAATAAESVVILAGSSVEYMRF